MKTLAVAILALFLLFSCGEGAQSIASIPSNILPKDTFIAVLMDFSLAESITNLNIKSVPPVKFDSAYAFNPLKQRHIRKSQFDSTINYYSAHPGEYRVIYDTVLSHLNTFRLARERSKSVSPAK